MVKTGQFPVALTPPQGGAFLRRCVQDLRTCVQVLRRCVHNQFLKKRNKSLFIQRLVLDFCDPQKLLNVLYVLKHIEIYISNYVGGAESHPPTTILVCLGKNEKTSTAKHPQNHPRKVRQK